jgi:predicted alpha/beta-hydrolase family hydrolase
VHGAQATSIQDGRVEYPARVSVVRIEVDDQGNETSASLREPRSHRAFFVLGHGAGGDRKQESLVRFQDALYRRGLASLVFNFPYSEKGTKRPDPMPRLERAYLGAVAFARGRLRPGEPLFAGGRSMGGRVATHLAAAGEPLAGLVLLGYPLHAAGKPEKLRVEHLPRIRVPLLFISGTRDALAPRAMLARTVSELGARIHWIEGADHGLDLPKRAGRDRASVAAEAADVVVSWI